MKNDQSPFAEMSYQAQQDKWREWRSRQLEYKKAEEETPPPEEKIPPSQPVSRPLPTRHRELDKVLSRHRSALKKAGAFCSTKEPDPQSR